MKYLLLSALLFFASSFASAQNYQPLQPGQMPFFTNGNHYLRGMRIDSVRIVSGDTVYYPYHTPRGFYACGSWPALDTMGGSWLGKKVIKRPNGDFLFDNMWGDTVTIKTQAHLGDTWTFFNDATAMSYKANVSNIGIISVLGVPDSAKWITIEADSNGVVHPDDPVNGFQLILSKNHGFIQTFDLYTFPYHRPNLLNSHLDFFDYYLDVLLDNLGTADLSCFKYTPHRVDTVNSIFRMVSLYDPTMREIYDFSVGDILETYFVHDAGSYGHTELDLNTIIGKTTTPYITTYTLSRRRKTLDASPTSYVENYYYDTVLSGGDTSHLLNFSSWRLPEEWGGFTFYHYDPAGTVIPSSGDSCLTTLYTFNRDNINPSGGVIFQPTDYNLANGYSNISYGIGYGMVSRHWHDYEHNTSEDNTYVYVKKSGSSCGIYQPVAIKDPEMSAQDVNVFPNPASSQLTISAPNTITSIAIYDAVGQLRYEHQHTDKTASVDVSMLSSGIYLLKINNNIVKKFSKQ